MHEKNQNSRRWFIGQRENAFIPGGTVAFEDFPFMVGRDAFIPRGAVAFEDFPFVIGGDALVP